MVYGVYEIRARTVLALRLDFYNNAASDGIYEGKQLVQELEPGSYLFLSPDDVQVRSCFYD